MNFWQYFQILFPLRIQRTQLHRSKSRSYASLRDEDFYEEIEGEESERLDRDHISNLYKKITENCNKKESNVELGPRLKLRLELSSPRNEERGEEYDN